MTGLPGLPQLVLLVDTGSSEISDNWKMTNSMRASGVIFTSVRNDVWQQLSLALPVVVTPGGRVARLGLHARGPLTLGRTRAQGPTSGETGSVTDQPLPSLLSSGQI